MRLAQITGITSPATRFTNSQTIVGDLVSQILIFAIAGAGFYFLVRIITSGFALLTSIGDPGKIQSAQKQITNALIGLIIVVSAFFVAQIIQTVFGIRII